MSRIPLRCNGLGSAVCRVGLAVPDPMGISRATTKRGAGRAHGHVDRGVRDTVRVDWDARMQQRAQLAANAVLIVFSSSVRRSIGPTMSRSGPASSSSPRWSMRSEWLGRTGRTTDPKSSGGMSHRPDSGVGEPAEWSGQGWPEAITELCVAPFMRPGGGEGGAQSRRAGGDRARHDLAGRGVASQRRSSVTSSGSFALVRRSRSRLVTNHAAMEAVIAPTRAIPTTMSVTAMTRPVVVTG